MLCSLHSSGCLRTPSCTFVLCMACLTALHAPDEHCGLLRPVLRLMRNEEIVSYGMTSAPGRVTPIEPVGILTSNSAYPGSHDFKAVLGSKLSKQGQESGFTEYKPVIAETSFAHNLSSFYPNERYSEAEFISFNIEGRDMEVVPADRHNPQLLNGILHASHW
ncbi:hypothetical protein C8Q79DRAFT_930662 [Trametes meyenii]|nr:hypothetical protein C8Q79DRAFT_930662 [Trametes meyenii]